MQKIVVDIYGADAGIEPVVAGIAKALKLGVEFFPVLVGDEAACTAILEREGISPDRYEILHTDKFITNDEPPTCVFAGREDSSLVMAYQRLKSDPECCGMLSAGSTGALLVGSIRHLGLLSGLKFPALASALPCGVENLVCLVDCGANISCTPADLARFATMGSIFSACFCGIAEPRVGLLNVGREPGKGTALHQEAYEKLAALPIRFVGNVEGSDLVSGYADVVVSDGFSGNILLKSTEAAGKLAIDIARQVGMDTAPALTEKIAQAIWRKLEFNSQGAATFLGTKKIVVKMHGCANEDTTVSSIRHIIRLQETGFLSAMAANL